LSSIAKLQESKGRPWLRKAVSARVASQSAGAEVNSQKLYLWRRGGGWNRLQDDGVTEVHARPKDSAYDFFVLFLLVFVSFT
jgi:hypothetical protein